MPVTFEVTPHLAREKPPAIHTASPPGFLLGKSIVAFSPSPAGAEVAHSEMANGFLQAVHLAFQHHLALVLKPDHLWFLVVGNLSLFINSHSESARSAFVEHKDGTILEVSAVGVSPEKGPEGRDWGPAVGLLASGALKRSKDGIPGLVVPRFSTTGGVERVAFQIALLDSLRSYYSHRVSSLCGIPSITLLGEREDWHQLAVRVGVLRQHVASSHTELASLRTWFDELLTVLPRFLDVWDPAKKVDRAWRSFYKYESQSGHAAITGWANLFFPFLRPGWNSFSTGQGNLARNPLTHYGRAIADEHFSPRPPEPCDIPGLISVVPFVWRTEQGARHGMELYAGFMHPSYDAAAGTVSPELGWAVVQCAPKQGC